MKNQEYYNKIFNEYKELEAKTFIPVNDVVKGKKIIGVHIKPEDLFRRDEVREELRKGLNFLSNEQLEFLYDDSDSLLVLEAVKTLANRDLINNNIN